MRITVSAQTEKRARQLAKEVHNMLISSFTFDGSRLKRAPSITLRDTIIARMVDPDDLVRVQLKYPEDGPDDHWYAACEALLGGGIKVNDKRFRILGGSSSIKKGTFWLATEDVRKQLHPYFRTSQEALSYLGVLFSGCHHGIHRLEGMKGRIVKDGQYGTADGQGYLSLKLLKLLKYDQRQLQIRFVGDEPGQRWLGKGTLLPADLPDGLDFLLPDSMVKGAGTPPQNKPWTCWFGVRDVAKSRPYSSSFSFAQWFSQDVLDAVWPTAEKKLDIIQRALTNRDSALTFLGLVNRDDTLNDARTKAEAFLEAGVGPDHPWLRRQLVQLMRREYVRLATGAGFELTGRMGAFANLPDDTICASDLPAGPVVLSRYPIRDPHSITAVWNEPDAVEHALPGTIYLNNTTAEKLDGDFDGDYYVTCTQEAAVDAVASTSWYSDYHRQDAPPKTRLKDPLTTLPYVAVKAIGNRIGSITYAISGAVHAGKLDKVAPLSAGLQAEVQSLKWDTRADRKLLEDPDLQMPGYIADAKQDKKLFVQYAKPVPGDFPLILNYNRVVSRWQADTTQTTPLVHFKHLVPVWLEPVALDFVEETKAVVVTYNRWIASILAQNPEPTDDDLAGPLQFLEAWDHSKTENRRAWAVALWHVVHGSRADTTGSATFHAFAQEMVDLMMQEQDADGKIRVPRRANGQAPQGLTERVVPLVGGMKAFTDGDDAFRRQLHAMNEPVTIQTRPNGGANAAFWQDTRYLGQVPKDHLLYSAIPSGLSFTARLELRGRTVYLSPTSPEWMTATSK